MKTAIITGSCGQDGSYLAELLLEKGYRVIAVERRVSSREYPNTKHLLTNANYIVEDGDVTDFGSMARLVKEYLPDEMYQLAAQSFVAASWTSPLATAEINYNGVANCLEAVRLFSPKTKFYQASTSEQFGDFTDKNKKLNEDSPCNPRSPYAAAKHGAEGLVKVYRDSYNIFACAGRLFNHESVPKNSPIMIKDDRGMIDIHPIEDIFKSENHVHEGILEKFIGQSVWNGENWTKIIKGTAYRDQKKPMRMIQTVSSCYEATLDHVAFDDNDNEIATKDIKVGDLVFKTQYPEDINSLCSDIGLARFFGFVVGDGHVSEDGNSIRLTGANKESLISIADIVKSRFGWNFKVKTYGPGGYDGCVTDVWQLDIYVDSNWGKWLRSQLYTNKSSEKRIPYFILNASKEVKQSFFDGYYLADGRNVGSERYHYKGFTTNSATLCLGLLYIFKSFSSQVPKVKCEYKDGARYYVTQFRTPEKTTRGNHRKKPLNKVVKTIETASVDGYFYDIQTESQTFATGPNLFKIHNSPRRGKQFVTRKVTDYIGRSFNLVDKFVKENLKPINGETLVLDAQTAFEKALEAGVIEPLAMGNLESMRDWAHAKDMVRGMWLMLQQEVPDDYVLATGRSVSIKEFLDMAFGFIGVSDWSKFITVDEKFLRPAEVSYLCGDATKAKEKLGWTPEITLEALIEEMISNDIALNRK